MAEQMGKTEGVYHQRVVDLSAFVVAGGKSARMGQDKAFLKLGEQTLVERALEIARSVADEVRIAGAAQKFSAFGSVVEDIYRERGPLGGIHAALGSSATEWNLMLAVDLPFMEPEFLRWLIEEARKSEAVVTVPRAGGGWQPLCAVYRKSFAGVAQRALDAGKNKIDLLFREVETRAVEEDEILRRGYSLEMFRNVNTPEEWQEVLSAEHRVPRTKD